MTGVQTCALPISRKGLVSWRPRTGKHGAAQYAEEHVLEVLNGSVVERAPTDAPLDATPDSSDDAT